MQLANPVVCYIRLASIFTANLGEQKPPCADTSSCNSPCYIAHLKQFVLKANPGLMNVIYNLSGDERQGQNLNSYRSSDLLRLAEGVSRSQDQISSTATKMLHSADAVRICFGFTVYF